MAQGNGTKERKPYRSRPPRGWLWESDVLAAWPSVWNVGELARANGVRARSEYGGMVYDGPGVRRVAGALADGTAVVHPAWRTDTPEGRAALEATRQRYLTLRHHRRTVQLALVALLLILTVSLIALTELL